MTKSPAPVSYRYESFGGILASDNPPLLAFVDRKYMKSLGLPASTRWKTRGKGYLSAPTEVHYAVTEKCSQSCPACYMESLPTSDGELSLRKAKAVLKLLSEMGVFHVALGGGEAFDRADFPAIARYARKCGLVPNLTTNGQGFTAERARLCRAFGQVNVSLDAPDRKGYALTRKAAGYKQAMEAVSLLRKNRVRVGINCVVSRRNFPSLKGIFALARKWELEDIEFLRYKPVGRGRHHYKKMRLTPSQHKRLFPTLLDLSREFSVSAKIDCSFMPMLCFHNPPPNLLKRHGVMGCEAGNFLLAVRANGRFSGCSFCENSESVFDLPRLWDHSDHLKELRRWTRKAPQPCRACKYLRICKGGCHAVARFVTGDLHEPDPECPFVLESSRNTLAKHQ